MPILDRSGFLHSLIFSAKVDPAKFLQVRSPPDQKSAVMSMNLKRLLGTK
jgi:hypothetical protein